MKNILNLKEIKMANQNDKIKESIKKETANMSDEQINDLVNKLDIYNQRVDKLGKLSKSGKNDLMQAVKQSKNDGSNMLGGISFMKGFLFVIMLFFTVIGSIQMFWYDSSILFYEVLIWWYIFTGGTFLEIIIKRLK